MQYYPDRMQAIRAAQALGWKHFDTLYDPAKGHYPSYSSGAAAEWAEVWAEDYMITTPRNPRGFVTHVGQRGVKPVIRISCRLDELEPSERPPEQFIVEPQTPSLWEADRGGDDDKPTGVSARHDASLRARSTFTGSPVAFVHGMCDDMHKAGQFDRKVAVQRAIDAGVTPNTAAAQVYRWRKNNNM